VLLLMLALGLLRLLGLLLELLLELLLHLAMSHLKHPPQLHQCKAPGLRSRCNERCNRRAHASTCCPKGSMSYEPCRLGHGIHKDRANKSKSSNFRSSIRSVQQHETQRRTEQIPKTCRRASS